MIERLGLTTVSDIEAALADVGARIELPPTPDLAQAVSARLRALDASSRAPAPRARPATERRRVPVIRSVRRSLLLAAVITILVVGATLGVRYGLDLLDIEFGPAPAPPVTPAPSARASPGAGLGAGFELGARSSLEVVASEVDFPVLVPAELGPPDGVFLGGSTLRGQVAFVYGPRSELPASELLAGSGLLLTQNRGDVDEGLVNKLVGSDRGTVTRVDVGGDEGYWFAGEPHWFWYLAADGTVVEDSRRLVGNTLAWQRGDILYRIEGAIDLERALEIAASLR